MVAAIFDRYDIKNSIKSAERERRSKSFFTAKVVQVIEGRIIPDWKKFLSSGENKVIDKISVSKARECQCLEILPQYDLLLYFPYKVCQHLVHTKLYVYLPLLVYLTNHCNQLYH
jgi:hypothetical protein